MSDQRKCFNKVTLEVSLFKNTKGTFVLMLLTFRRASNNLNYYLFNKWWIEPTTKF